jgi:DNA-binding MurR/RpiR family transcriptional regulator
MDPQPSHTLLQLISERHAGLTPKARAIGDYILNNPRKVMFMTTKELAAAVQVSEATVVRFVAQLGYEGYSGFLQALRDLVDRELTLLDRVDLADMKAPGSERFRRAIFAEIDNIKQLYENMDMETLDQAVNLIHESPAVYVIGSRLSYTLAYYMGWSLTKIRGGIHILRGSDTTAIDWLTIAPAESLTVVFAVSRYPNELIRIGKLVRRLGRKLLVITDSSLCPLIQFAHLSLIAPSRHIPLIGSPTTLGCLINYLILEVASRDGDRLKNHQEKLEQIYLENDILFNPNRDMPESG